MGHTLQLYIVHRMKALPEITPLTGLDNFFRCGAGALARESFWVAQRLQRCDSAYVTTTLSHHCHSEPASAVRNLLSQAGGSHPFSSWLTLFYPSGRLIPSLPSPFRGGIAIARHVSAGSARDRDPFFELHSVVLKSIAELDVYRIR